jgi:hypothetical protein
VGTAYLACTYQLELQLTNAGNRSIVQTLFNIDNVLDKSFDGALLNQLINNSVALNFIGKGSLNEIELRG